MPVVTAKTVRDTKRMLARGMHYEDIAVALNNRHSANALKRAVAYFEGSMIPKPPRDLAKAKAAGKVVVPVMNKTTEKFPFTAEDDEAIRTGLEDGMSIEALAVLLQRGEGSIEYRINKVLKIEAPRMDAFYSRHEPNEHVDNVACDSKYQAAMRAAIQNGLERQRSGMVTEFGTDFPRVVHVTSTPLARSSAADCADLGGSFF